MVYHPTITDTCLLENSNRGIFPTSLCSSLTSNWSEEKKGEDDIQPIMFVVNGQEGVKPVYVTAHEFSAQEDMVYLPARLMQEAFIQEGERVEVRDVNLPKINSLTLQPRNNQFAESTAEPKLVLEKAIVERYQVLSIGDSIHVNGHELTVTDISPSTTCTTHNSDPEVDFRPSEEQVEIDRRNEILKQREQQEKEERDRLEKQRTTELEKDYQQNTNGFQPFGGVGRTLDGSRVCLSSTTNNENNTSNLQGLPQTTPLPSIRRAPRPSKITQSSNTHSGYQAFGGEGRTLGTS